MKDTYEDYVKPPSYIDSQGSDNILITKLSTRIQKHLNQINGVYDCRITDADEKKKKMILKIEQGYNEVINTINKQRNKDISNYNDKAEHHIDTLISTMHNSHETIVLGWWEKLFGS
jgi:hypothetical protein